MRFCSWLDRISPPWRTPPKLKTSNAEKPCIIESTYPRGLGKVISSVTRYQRQTANPSPRTLRESLGDHYGPAIVIVMYSHCVCKTICAFQPSAAAVATYSFSTRDSEDQLRYGIPVDRLGRDNISRLNCTRIDWTCYSTRIDPRRLLYRSIQIDSDWTLSHENLRTSGDSPFEKLIDAQIGA